MEIKSIGATIDLKDGRTVFLSAVDPEHLANQIQELLDKEEEIADLSSIDLERR